MIYVIALGLALLQVTLGARIHLFGGVGYYLPALMFVSSAHGAWREWGIWLLALGLTSYFAPLSWSTLLLIVTLSLVTYFVFRHWIDDDNPVLKLFGELGTLGLFLLLITFEATRTINWLVLGSFLLSAPLILLWHMTRSRKRSVAYER